METNLPLPSLDDQREAIRSEQGKDLMLSKAIPGLTSRRKASTGKTGCSVTSHKMRMQRSTAKLKIISSI